MELLADVIRPQKPFGRVDQQDQRPPKGRRLAQTGFQQPVKGEGKPCFAQQRDRPHKQQNAGGAPRHGQKQRQHRHQRQAAELVRLPHGVEQRIAAQQPVAQGQGVLFVNFQPGKQAVPQRQQGQNKGNHAPRRKLFCIYGLVHGRCASFPGSAPRYGAIAIIVPQNHRCFNTFLPSAASRARHR